VSIPAAPATPPHGHDSAPDAVAAQRQPGNGTAPNGLEFIGWYLPRVRMVFASPSRGHEDQFVPVFAGTANGQPENGARP